MKRFIMCLALAGLGLAATVVAPGAAAAPAVKASAPREARETRSGSGTVAPGAPAAVTENSNSASPSNSSDVAALLDRLRSIPEVRADRLSQVGDKLERGAYLTREAAEQTAAALLGGRNN